MRFAPLNSRSLAGSGSGGSLPPAMKTWNHRSIPPAREHPLHFLRVIGIKPRRPARQIRWKPHRDDDANCNQQQNDTRDDRHQPFEQSKSPGIIYFIHRNTN
jgi:hypothetical protein